MPWMKRRRATRKGQHQRGCDQSGAGHQGAVVGSGLGGGEQQHAQRRRRQFGGGDDHHGPVQIVPVRHERKHRKCRDGRAGRRQHDAPEDLQLAHAVHPPRMDHLVRKAAEELPQQEDREQGEEERQHLREVAVQRPEPGQPDVQRKRGGLDRHGQRRQHRQEKQPAAAERQFGQCIGRRYGHQQLHHQNAATDQQAIEHEAADRHGAQHLGIVAPAEPAARPGQPGGLEDFAG
jgi:hypothetical protein